MSQDNHQQSGRKKKASSVSLPLARIQTIMKSSPDAANVSSDAVLLTAKAAELFMDVLAKKALENSDKDDTIEYNDIARVVHSDPRFAFLKDIIPQKITVRAYRTILKEVEEKESRVGYLVSHTQEPSNVQDPSNNAEQKSEGSNDEMQEVSD
jgi:chromatin accessibility complex protein 1